MVIKFVLTRSVTSNGNCIKPLMNLLNENNIPYAIKGNKDLLDKDEIKSILTLIYYAPATYFGISAVALRSSKALYSAIAKRV